MKFPIRIAATVAISFSAAPLCAEKTPYAPIADYHIHLMGPGAVSLISEPLLPEVQLPKELGALLNSRGSNISSGDLTRSFTADASIWDPFGSRWLIGRPGVARISEIGGSYRLHPVDYSVDGTVGYVAGYFVKGEGEEIEPISSFLLAVKRESGGNWQITSEISTKDPPAFPRPFAADQLVAALDRAGIRKGVVPSVAYFFGSRLIPKPFPDEYDRVRAENDWAVSQAKPYPDRLVVFCGVNPLRTYATEEIDRCSKQPGVRGIKLHFDNSGVDLRKAKHVARLRQVFRAAEKRRLAILVHLKIPEPSYGPSHSAIFLKDVIPAAPNTPIQIAHLAGSGPGHDGDEALSYFADAAARDDPGMKNVFFDVASSVTASQDAAALERIAARLRQLGMRRVLFGSDYAGIANEPPDAAWKAFRRLPLNDEEFRAIASNIAPYLR